MGATYILQPESGLSPRHLFLPEGTALFRLDSEDKLGIAGGVFYKFYLVCTHMKGYGHAAYDLTSSGSYISILRVRGYKWHRATSLRATCVFNSFSNVELRADIVLSRRDEVHLNTKSDTRR
jgi:hypothetical protein